MQRTVFFVSDRTGITVETLAHSLLTQFEGVKFEHISCPFIDNADKLDAVVVRINSFASQGVRPIVFSTLVDAEARARIETCDAMVIELFDSFIRPLEQELGVAHAHVAGRAHGVDTAYHSRIEAVNFALGQDDGASTTRYPEADIVLVGVSRSGKTPTCLYLALQFGVLAANYPLVAGDLDGEEIPKVLAPYRDKLFGLTINPKRLQTIRAERRPDSNYSSKSQCEFEVRAAEAILSRATVPILDSSVMSVEEMATTIMDQAALPRRWFG